MLERVLVACLSIAVLEACRRGPEAPPPKDDELHTPKQPNTSEPWTRQFGTAHVDLAHALAVDARGNVFVAGLTDGVLPGQASAGKTDAFVRAYDASGRELWTHQFGTSALDSANGVAVDASGNLLVTGSTMGALPGQTSAGEEDVFVRKYDASGKELWTRQFGSSKTEFATAIAVDASGNVVVVGLTRGALPGHTSEGADDAFVRAYDPSGKELWTVQFGSGQIDEARSVAVDASGNVFVAGSTRGTLPGQTSSGADDAFVRSYDRSGKERWTQQFGSGQLDEAQGVVVDGAGNVVVAGHTEGTFPGQASAGGRDGFVRSYDASGNERWTRQFGSSQFDGVRGVAVDASGNVLVGGFTVASLPGQTSVGKEDAFVQSYDGSGKHRWTKQFGTDVYDSVDGIAVDASGKVLVVGSTMGTLPGQTSSGSFDVFVMRILR
ncbi:MAG: SBBP repeat-containing protein [Myxococcales bacterium]|nr:SBBP repeat-containing protein [Myxococcales bacterium]